jgi:hypothetical protein
MNPNKAGAIVGARLFVLATSAALSISVTASSPQEHANDSRPATGVAHRPLAVLEHVFWVCDHAATTLGVLDPDTAASCAAATREFRFKKFNGDLDAMLSWWRRNKAHQHQLLEMRRRGAGNR